MLLLYGTHTHIPRAQRLLRMVCTRARILVGLSAGTGFKLRSLWDHKELGEFKDGNAQFWVQAMEIIMLKVTPLA